MFKFLKEKLRAGIKKISSGFAKGPTEEKQESAPVEQAPEKVEPEAPAEKVVEKAEPVVEKVEQPAEKVEPPVEKVEKVEAPPEKVVEAEPAKVEPVAPSIEKAAVPVPEEKPKVVEKPAEEPPAEVKKPGLFRKLKEKLVTKKISEEKFGQLFWDLEVGLLENNVAVEVIEKVKGDLKEKLVDQPLSRLGVEKTIRDTLKGSLEEVLSVDPLRLEELIKMKKPYVICFVGINGSGKTTSIAKVAHKLLAQNLSVVLAAADTFRAASIEQLQEHGDKLGVRVIKHDYGSDPAAVAYDAVAHAKAKGIDVVLIDTAGRMHSNVNLQDEMKKIIKVAKPDLKIFVGEAITGNDCVEQAKKFNEAIAIDCIILSKADVDEKGGAAISVSYVTKKPILYLGVGQEYQDLKVFEPSEVLEGLGIS